MVQVYIIDPTGVTMTIRPWKRLGAFGRVALGPGESKAVTLTILEVRSQHGSEDVRARGPGPDLTSVLANGCSNKLPCGRWFVVRLALR